MIDTAKERLYDVIFSNEDTTFIVIIISILLNIILGALFFLDSPDTSELTKNDSPIYNDSPMLERNEKDIANIASARDEESPLNFLSSTYSNSLTSRVRQDFDNSGRALSEDAKIEFLQKKSDGEESLEISSGDVTSGMVTKGEIFVKISNDTKHNGVYALACLNGMVQFTSDNFYVIGPERDYPYEFEISPGKGLTEFLSNDEALQALKDVGLNCKSTRDNECVATWVYAGDIFTKECETCSWEYIRKP